jgi:hypothetical protein
MRLTLIQGLKVSNRRNEHGVFCQRSILSLEQMTEGSRASFLLYMTNCGVKLWKTISLFRYSNFVMKTLF